MIEYIWILKKTCLFTVTFSTCFEKKQGTFLLQILMYALPDIIKFPRQMIIYIFFVRVFSAFVFLKL